LYIALAALSVVTVLLVALYQIKLKQSSNNQAASNDAALAPLIQLPGFVLTSNAGHPFTSEQLQGKVWIADFIFTRCQGPCPMITLQMAKLEHQLRDDPRWDQLRLVSFSVDPDYDTPKVLEGHAQRVGVETNNWIWLTGERKPMWDLINNGFKLMVGRTDTVGDDPGHGLITHSTKFVLVDRRMRTRGYYDALQPDDIKRLLADVQTILNEQ
jgi:protein SCO1/2